MAKTPRRKLKDIAAGIYAHLKRFEADRTGINASKDGRAGGLRPYYMVSAYPAGSRVGITYITYQGPSTLTRDDAERYLEWLDAGNVGRHYEAGLSSRKRGPRGR